ncbi:putative Mg(2+) transport ATPase [Legionella quinlivanii]|uniref:Protein MgtC n=1 Tax=Legionella quinlivanii TaxID=45073 RepID=A0A0W0XM10_9GAMM|nr:MgtC/SapB family protein [Legionella quinlivanii]KTD45476.1 putative Mg(2+) transport ATPase [Legionella quinlivanii]MCW8451236.1 MgtC/SapB family protein [Legionella quinlivanii]SEG32738.1 putative Mg2+ transporter-C (MgtC) family protein [Legionella quinlivanii DSM 21216]STY10568.1 putative Mg(2+) transport ATPase [Legionella quinlivanii]
MMLSHLEIALRLCLAGVLGSVIGMERERVLWAAGLRTHMLVCVSSCLIMIVSAFSFYDILGTPNVILDPSRIAAQVVSGIGFLGAGAILLQGNVVRGLTTAASIWTVAGIGLAVGGGLYHAAFVATFIILVILLVIKPLEERFKSKKTSCSLTFYATQSAINYETLLKTLGEGIDTHINQFIVQPSQIAGYDEIHINLVKVKKALVTDIIDRMKHLDAIKDSEIKVKFHHPVSFR